MNDDATLHDAKLREVAQRLGATAAERLDVERAAEAVVTRLRAERDAGARERRWRWGTGAGAGPAWLRIAAAAVIVLGAGWLARGALRSKGGAGDVAAVAPAPAELNELAPEQLQELLSTIGRPEAEPATATQDIGLDELSTAQLRALLASLEG